jgi:hypothetical protein
MKFSTDVVIDLPNCELTFEGEVIPGYPATREDPGMPNVVENFKVKMGGVDITSCLSEYDIDYFGSLLIDDYLDYLEDEGHGRIL